MIESIKHIFDDVKLGTIKKEQVVKTLDQTVNNISNNVIPVIDTILAAKDAAAIKSSKDLSRLGQDAGFKTSGAVASLEKLKDFFLRVKEKANKLEDVVNKYLSQAVTAKGLTGRDGAILRVISDITSISLYVNDFLYIAILGNKKSGFPPIHIKQVESGYINFTSLLRTYYKNLEKIIDGLKEVSTEQITLDADDSILEVMLSRTGKIVDLPATRGFLYNPFYHIRLWWSDYQHDKYKANLEKKRLLELKVLSLVSEKESAGADKNKIDKQIEYYEDLITDTEHDIKEYEESVV